MNKYEFHFTVKETTLPLVLVQNRIRHLHNSKILDISLSSGIYPRQIMFGMSALTDTTGEAFYYCGHICKHLQEYVLIDRVKVEGHPSNVEDPSAEVLYWEAHWKVRKGTIPTDLGTIRAQAYRILVSYNNSQPDIEYWTLRRRPSEESKESFKEFYDHTTAGVYKRGILVKPPHMEVALIDTNIDLDKGWDIVRAEDVP